MGMPMTDDIPDSAQLARLKRSGKRITDLIDRHETEDVELRKILQEIAACIHYERER
jgi:hypothetical protein